MGIGALCALLIVTVYSTTEARIRDNRQRALEQAISQVLPQAHAVQAIRAGDDGRLATSAGNEDLPVFLGYDADAA